MITLERKLTLGIREKDMKTFAVFDALDYFYYSLVRAPTVTWLVRLIIGFP